MWVWREKLWPLLKYKARAAMVTFVGETAVAAAACVDTAMCDVCPMVDDVRVMRIAVTIRATATAGMDTAQWFIDAHPPFNQGKERQGGHYATRA